MSGRCVIHSCDTRLLIALESSRCSPSHSIGSQLPLHFPSIFFHLTDLLCVCVTEILVGLCPYWAPSPVRHSIRNDCDINVVFVDDADGGRTPE